MAARHRRGQSGVLRDVEATFDHTTCVYVRTKRLGTVAAVSTVGTVGMVGMVGTVVTVSMVGIGCR